MLKRETIKGGAAPTDELTADLRATVGVRTTPPGVKPTALLADEVIHQQDVRRVLHLSRSSAEDPLQLALDEMRDASVSLLPGKKRRAGSHLVASDIAWDAGEPGDPEVRGTGEAVPA